MVLKNREQLYAGFDEIPTEEIAPVLDELRHLGYVEWGGDRHSITHGEWESVAKECDTGRQCSETPEVAGGGLDAYSGRSSTGDRTKGRMLVQKNILPRATYEQIKYNCGETEVIDFTKHR